MDHAPRDLPARDGRARDGDGPYNWAQIIGFLGGQDGASEVRRCSGQAATVYFCGDPAVAAYGLWLATPWGAVVWLTTIAARGGGDHKPVDGNTADIFSWCCSRRCCLHPISRWRGWRRASGRRSSRYFFAAVAPCLMIDETFASASLSSECDEACGAKREQSVPMLNQILRKPPKTLAKSNVYSIK